MPAADAFTPMLARLAHELPAGGFLYEPKWDGFRCVASVSRGAVDLRSRNGRPFARYFPEIVAALAPVGDAVLDGEIVVAGAGGLDFAALLSRLHPAASRVERLARETPAVLVVFDLLAVGAEELASHPLVERRARAEALLAGARAPLVLTPATRDLAVAQAGSIASSAAASTASSRSGSTVRTSPAAAAGSR